MLRTFGVAGPRRRSRRLQDALQSPTLNVRGLASAHVGAGARTIIPDRATAAIDLRLVKETPAADLVDKLRAHVRSAGLPPRRRRAGRCDAREAWEARALVVSETMTERLPDSATEPQARRVGANARDGFGAPPVQLRTLGGTVPIAPFIEAFGFPAVLVPS